MPTGDMYDIPLKLGSLLNALSRPGITGPEAISAIWA
jgi:hypothetical protein